uniref:Uncharacterized protein n=1 Tax=Zea mays TaxID=4577 RepID=B4FPG1_MAIZE|nr:uncharacterized protein LOC100272588 [Zea mays]ACF84004.1 unknown [Zea mays]|eukprot:NP_001140523.1 uncharacterized protein LOC100272588 [Zea mays]
MCVRARVRLQIHTHACSSHTLPRNRDERMRGARSGERRGKDMKLLASEWNVVWFKVLLSDLRMIHACMCSFFCSSDLQDLGPGFIPLRNSFKIIPPESY